MILIISKIKLSLIKNIKNALATYDSKKELGHLLGCATEVGSLVSEIKGDRSLSITMRHVIH